MSATDILATFRAEAEETLEALAHCLSDMNAGQKDPELVHAVFRAAHTLKGAALTVGRRDIGELAHVVEELFARWRDGRLIPTGAQTVWAAAVVEVLREQLADDRGQERSAAAAAAADSSSELTLKVPQRAIDSLLTTTGELVLTHGRMSACVGELAAELQPKLQDILDSYAKLLAMLREDVTQLRLVSLAPLVGRIRATAQETARKLGKQLELVVEGAEHCLDASLAEGLRDPFMHLVRNAIDHGLETPEQRVACGKPAAGRLHLRIDKLAGRVVLSLSDDGRGLDAERIEKKARERGIYPTGVQLTVPEIQALIFAPGFSTAERITEISGRGVGLDVVSKKVRALHGVVGVSSEKGTGTTFTISMPLDLTIMDGTLFEAANQQFAVPDDRVLEFIELGAATQAALSTLDVHGQLVPCIRLAALFGGSDAPVQRQTALVLSYSGGRVGLVVDRSHGTQQLVVRSAGPLLRSLPLIAGAAVLGSGDVALLLDIEKLVGSTARAPALAGAAYDESRGAKC